MLTTRTLHTGSLPESYKATKVIFRSNVSVWCLFHSQCEQFHFHICGPFTATQQPIHKQCLNTLEQKWQKIHTQKRKLKANIRYLIRLTPPPTTPMVKSKSFWREREKERTKHYTRPTHKQRLQRARAFPSLTLKEGVWRRTPNMPWALFNYLTLLWVADGERVGGTVRGIGIFTGSAKYMYLCMHGMPDQSTTKDLMTYSQIL